MFICDQCGICCEHIDESGIEGVLNRGDGVCINYDEETHLCNIYDNRPIYCNVDKFYESFLENKYSREDYYEINYKSCQELKERYGK
jgi:hypothetical protein